MDKVKRPEATLKLEESGVEFKMTYLMLNDILGLVGGPGEAAQALLTDQFTRDFVIRRLSTPADDSVKEEEDLVKTGDVKIEIYEIEEVIGWVIEHVTYFFMRTGKKVQEKTQHLSDDLEKMVTTTS